MDERYMPELGQMARNDLVGYYSVAEYASVLVEAILADIGRVYCNRFQKEWDYYDDPQIPGLEYRHYYWGDDDEEAAKPNFVFGDVEIRWYKYPGRGMSCNVTMKPDEWRDWFDLCMAAVRAADKDEWAGGVDG